MTAPADEGPGGWIARHAGAVILSLLVATAGLVGPFLLLPPRATASQEPQTPLFEARRRAADRFASPAHRMVYVVEARGGTCCARRRCWSSGATPRPCARIPPSVRACCATPTR